MAQDLQLLVDNWVVALLEAQMFQTNQIDATLRKDSASWLTEAAKCYEKTHNQCAWIVDGSEMFQCERGSEFRIRPLITYDVAIPDAQVHHQNTVQILQDAKGIVFACLVEMKPMMSIRTALPGVHSYIALTGGIRCAMSTFEWESPAGTLTQMSGDHRIQSDQQVIVLYVLHGDVDAEAFLAQRRSIEAKVGTFLVRM